ncbi:hypothetical protein TVAG_321800 [Trichomonas vaginalis G3]|uniref:Uncharacterized protein n=1 Tax=Trichomonas vaginalis (strain ATCC PRA-98 / G3) TaxID=412133 RepID=A2FQF8_TRIV3|nr:hypothetical protein TVAGG3_0482110 [Trichomonas vaginalis G3]EAX92866.1 hypothetical protein TVAG_321800 [Trichomonas vaginalis G3]KAI5515782.1 hypothetical protein TVAGG3_0482110 [Trichomonas vaginalis G3]|eukprot:XP_001305796.1 hypothetical protein [Trichomonas vaginalis G3]
MNPKTKEVSGFYKLNDMKEDDEKELEFSFSSSNPGSYKLFVFIGYSNENRELIGMKKYFSNVEVFQESSSDIPLYPCFRSEAIGKTKEPNFKLSLNLENNNLEILVSPKSESLKDLKLEVSGMIVGKSIIRIEHIKRGNSFSHKVVVLSYKNLIVRVHTKLTSYATNISKYLEYLSK